MGRRFDIDHFRLLVAVAEGGNFSRAAAALGRTQSAVSMQAKSCEAIAGTDLFVRTPRRVHLTPAGERLVGQGRRVLAIEAQARAELRGRGAASVRLGVPDDYAHLLPGLLRRYAAVQPWVDLVLACRPSAELYPALDRGDLDLAVVTRGSGQPGEVVRLEPLVWVAARTVRPEGIAPLPLALYQPGCVGRDHALRALGACGRAFRVAYESPSLTGLLAAVRAGLAVAALARTSVPPDLRELGSAECGLPMLPALEIGIVVADRRSGTEVTALADVLRAEIARG